MPDNRIHEAKMSVASCRHDDGTVTMSMSLDGKTFFITASFTADQWDAFSHGGTANEVNTYHWGHSPNKD